MVRRQPSPLTTNFGLHLFIIMAQPTPMDVNGASTAGPNLIVAPGKRKRDSEDDGTTPIAHAGMQNEAIKNSESPHTPNGINRDYTDVVQNCFTVLQRYDDVLFFVCSDHPLLPRLCAYYCTISSRLFQQQLSCALMRMDF